ncbi:MAG: LuxR C-terminal-related transcriptional regulator [bacterium]
MDDKIKQLIIENKNNKNKMYELWREILEYEDEYDKNHLEERLKSFAYSRNYEYDDVYQNAFICFLNLFENFDINKTKGTNLKKSFLGYIHNYLFKRLNNYKDGSMFLDSKIISYDEFENIEFLNEDLEVETINDNFIDTLIIDNCYDKLSNREKEVYNLLREGYDHGYIANKLEIDRRDVYRYKERISKKVK